MAVAVAAVGEDSLTGCATLRFARYSTCSTACQAVAVAVAAVGEDSLTGCATLRFVRYSTPSQHLVEYHQSFLFLLVQCHLVHVGDIFTFSLRGVRFAEA